MPPALGAWLARQNAAPHPAFLDRRRNCDARNDSAPGDQPWSAWERENVLRPPHFCYDPEIALVANSEFPDSIRPRWNWPGKLESPPAFLAGAGAPTIGHEKP
jgi:hypothetical protein